MDFEFRDIGMMELNGEHYPEILWYKKDMHYGQVDIDSHVIITNNFHKDIVRKNLREMASFQLKFNSNKKLNKLVQEKIFFNN